MESFQMMMDAGNYLPEHVKPWTLWMQGILFFVPIIFLRHLAPRLLIVTQVLNTLVAYLVFTWEGDQVTKLFGIGHFFWIWPAFYLLRDCQIKELSLYYRGFAITALLTISISLVLDVRETTHWLLGDRNSILVGVPIDHPLYRND